MFHLCAKDTGDFRPVTSIFSTSEHIPPNSVLFTFCSSSSEVSFPDGKPTNGDDASWFRGRFVRTVLELRKPADLACRFEVWNHSSLPLTEKATDGRVDGRPFIKVTCSCPLQLFHAGSRTVLKPTLKLV